MRERRTAQRERGFAAFVAVAMILIVGMGTLALTVLFQYDIERTQRYARETQQRELTLAGAVIAKQSLNESTPPVNEVVIQLPEALEDAGLLLRYSPTDASQAEVAVTADAGLPSKARHTLSYSRSDSGWELTAATPIELE